MSLNHDQSVLKLLLSAFITLGIRNACCSESNHGKCKENSCHFSRRRGGLISQLSYQYGKGNTCFKRQITKWETFGLFRYISGHCLPFKVLSILHYIACLTPTFSSNSRRKVTKWIHVEVLQSKTKVTMTLVLCRDRKRCYLYDDDVKASQRVGKGSQNRSHYISDSHLWRQDLSAVTGWHTLKRCLCFKHTVHFFPEKDVQNGINR